MRGFDRTQPLREDDQVGLERTSDMRQLGGVLGEMLPEIRELLALAAKSGFRVPAAFVLRSQEK
jgi:hypothetical protein